MKPDMEHRESIDSVRSDQPLNPGLVHFPPNVDENRGASYRYDDGERNGRGCIAVTLPRLLRVTTAILAMVGGILWDEQTGWLKGRSLGTNSLTWIIFAYNVLHLALNSGIFKVGDKAGDRVARLPRLSIIVGSQEIALLGTGIGDGNPDDPGNHKRRWKVNLCHILDFVLGLVLLICFLTEALPAFSRDRRGSPYTHGPYTVLVVLVASFQFVIAIVTANKYLRKVSFAIQLPPRDENKFQYQIRLPQDDIEARAGGNNRGVSVAA